MAREAVRMCVRCDEFAPSAVRHAMTRLSTFGGPLGDAMLVASELVTNAVRHSLCTEDELLNVCITHDGRLRIVVVDPGGSGREAQIADRPIELGGLGLKVVEQLATHWGTERRDDGYRVWAELDVRS
jgi:anti-sigma regulatory factor (Ser/Thr protein kinase)